MVIHHTRMAPAAIQKQRRRVFIPAEIMGLQDSPATASISGISLIYVFNTGALNQAYFNFGVPKDWIAGTDMFLYPIFCTDVNLFANARWGIQHVWLIEQISYASVPTRMERTVACNGTATIIPKKPEWLTIACPTLYIPLKEDTFQRNNFTNLGHISFQLYRDGVSLLDNCAGNAALFGVMIEYDAFI